MAEERDHQRPDRGQVRPSAGGRANHFIVSLGIVIEPTEASGGDPLADFALAAKVECVYRAGRPTGITVQGVRMEPVHQLTTLLGLSAG